MNKDLDYIQQQIDNRVIVGLYSEVCFSALEAMKENPELSITEAFEAGCREWDV